MKKHLLLPFHKACSNQSTAISHVTSWRASQGARFRHGKTVTICCIMFAFFRSQVDLGFVLTILCTEGKQQTLWDGDSVTPDSSVICSIFGHF